MAKDPSRTADAETRRTYFPDEISPCLYGSPPVTPWSRRRHRAASRVLHATEVADVVLCGVELHTISLPALEVDSLVIHLAVVPRQARDLAARQDADLDILRTLLMPVRHLHELPLPGLAEGVGLTEDHLATALAGRRTWFSVLRTCDDPGASDVVLRGAAIGSSPRAVQATTEQLRPLREGRVFSPSATWSCEAGTRGLGFVRHLEERNAEPDFYDIAGPAYVRTIYFDFLHLVALQDLLLGQLRNQILNTQMPQVGGSAKQFEAVSQLQRSAAHFRIRMWWTHLGRGSWQERAFRLLQSDWDLRTRLDDVDAETAALAQLVATVAEQDAAAQRVWSRRVSMVFSVLLGAVAALAVPQTMLTAIALDGVSIPQWLPDRNVIAQLSIWMALVGLILLPVTLVLALLLVLTGARGGRGRGRARGGAARRPDHAAASHGGTSDQHTI